MKKSLIIMMAAFLAFTATACSTEPPEDRPDYTINETGEPVGDLTYSTTLKGGSCFRIRFALEQS